MVARPLCTAKCGQDHDRFSHRTETDSWQQREEAESKKAMFGWCCQAFMIKKRLNGNMTQNGIEHSAADGNQRNFRIFWGTIDSWTS